LQRLVVFCAIFCITLICAPFLLRLQNPADLFRVIEIPLERPVGFTFVDDVFEYDEIPYHAIKIFSLKTGLVETIDISSSTKLADNSIIQERTFESSPFVSLSGPWCLSKSGEILVERPYLSHALLSKSPQLKHSRNIGVFDFYNKQVSVIQLGERLDTNRKYPSFLDTTSCIYHVSSIDAPDACARREPYLSCTDKSEAKPYMASFPYKQKAFTDKEKGITYKYKGSLEQADWPLLVSLYQGDTKLADSVHLPEGRFVGGGERFACFSCGCSCYRDLSLVHVKGDFYAIVTGWSVEDKMQGIYHLEGKRWRRVVRIGENSRFLAASKNGCRIIWSEAKQRHPTPADTLKWKLVDICPAK
jgi:hypothetical protein